MSLVGIDLGMHKVAMMAMDGELPIDAEVRVSMAEHRDRELAELAGAVAGYVSLHGCDYVFIEDVIIGNNHKYSIALAQTLGAVLASLNSVRHTVGSDIRLVNNKEWKKQLLGNGNAGKEQIRNYICETHPAYAALCGDDQDLYDASCVGLYGLGLLDRAQHLTL